MHYSRLRLSLTETCRQAYNETKRLPFALNTFVGYTEALLAAFPGRRCHRAQFDCINTVHLMVQKRDLVVEARERDMMTSGDELPYTLWNTLRTLRGLSGLRVLRVVWDGARPCEQPWEIFSNDVVSKMTKGLQQNKTKVELVTI